MKRFIADALLLCMLVSIGSYMYHTEPSDKRFVVEQQVEEFEDEVAQSQIAESKQDTVALKDIEENRASRLAKTSSEVVISTVNGCVNVVSQIFQALIK
ncbi:hypothetical protein WKT02_00035 [Erysipelotrichaceae bacterium HCN-30851]